MLRFAFSALALVVMTSSMAAGFEFFQPLTPPRRCQVMAHRGQSRQAPENTAPAIEHAIRDLLEWVEVDVRLTADGQHVLLHDETLERTTNGTGRVGDKTWAELQTLDAGEKFASRFAGTRLLSLDECLTLAKGRVNLYLDCKRIDPELLIKQIRAAGMERQVVVFDSLEHLREIRRLSQGAVAVMPKWRPGANLDAILELQPAIVEIDAADITPEICERFHARGIGVQAQTLGESDRAETWKRLLAAGIDYVQTDLPEEFLAVALREQVTDLPAKMALHRGASRYAPENTRPAIEKALALGADYVEIDVRTSADGKWFLLHDATVDSRTNGAGKIAEMNAGELEKLDAGSWFSREFAGLRLMELDPALALLRGKSGCYFDAKAISPDAILAGLREHDLLATSVIFQGPGFLAQVREREPAARIMPPLYRAADLERAIERLRPAALDVKWEELTPDLIERCHQADVLVFSDAIGDTDRYDQHLEKIRWGIDVIQTDHPLQFFRAVELHAMGR